jgi:hypothetical protein
MTMKAMIGPYLGEFGWELCVWNPLARAWAAAARTIGAKITVLAPASSRWLYEFADEFYPVEGRLGTSESLSGIPAGPGLEEDWELARSLGCTAYLCPSERVHGDPERTAFGDPSALRVAGLNAKKVWRRLGTSTLTQGLRPDVCLAFRPPKFSGGRTYPEKSWPQERCQELVTLLQSKGLNVATVGGKDNWSAGVGGWFDFRGQSLEVQCAAIASSRVVIGPSSGPLHLASLCEIPHVTWYGRDGQQNLGSRARYASVWNPFQTPHRFLDELVPSVEEVFAAARGFLA